MRSKAQALKSNQHKLCMHWPEDAAAAIDGIKHSTDCTAHDIPVSMWQAK
jgi:hypothetical protein